MIKKWLWIAFFLIIPFPWLYHRIFPYPADPLATALLTGGAIVAASFLLSWIAEVAQLDIPQALAFAAVALIAVLPEYAVDMYFAWMAGKDPHYTPYALANMTGSNRLLIGGGWAFVMLIYYMKTKKREIALFGENAVDITCLMAASLYALIIPLKGNLSLADAFFFVALFLFYIWNATRCGVVEPEISGPQEAIAALPAPLRRCALVALIVYSGLVIFVSAAPFAESLISIGKQLGINEFVLVQWIAPVASESPEFIVATLFALHGFPAHGINCLISSKVNQWTLLVGMLPIVYVLSAGKPVMLALDGRQTEEVFLTAAQSLFAITLISKYRITVTHALILFGLFASQFFIIHPTVRWIYGAFYFIGALCMIAFDRQRRANLGIFFSRTCRMPEK